MSSFRNHRVIIASLFLPTTAVQGESGPPTPDPPLATTTVNDPEINLPAVTLRLAATPLKPALVNRNNTHSRQSSVSGPLKSIVDDLTDKVLLRPFPLLSPLNPISYLSSPDTQHQPSDPQTQKSLTPSQN